MYIFSIRVRSLIHSLRSISAPEISCVVSTDEKRL